MSGDVVRIARQRVSARSCRAGRASRGRRSLRRDANDVRTEIADRLGLCSDGMSSIPQSAAAGIEVDRKRQRRQFGERTAMNHPMQGSAADIIKKAMVEVQRKLASGGFGAKMLLQVHDELCFSVPEAELEQVRALVKETMENVVSLRVPLVVDASDGANWGEAH